MSSIKALIVDDSSVMRKIVERSLLQAGVELSKVFEAGNGAEALAVLAENRVELILCDINMPVMDGPGVCKAAFQRRERHGRPRGYDHHRGK
jgi:two-component system chemotaxis response regulator CheY